MGSTAGQHAEIVIAGAGFAGLGMAIRLKKAGINDFRVIERAGDVGGVWRDNTYPGCACDVESHLYSLSFAPEPKWTRLFAGQEEIRSYLRACAERFDLLPHLQFRRGLERADWDESAQLWRIETSTGPMTARFLISAMGALSEPASPRLPGLERFRGRAFHSARWDHGHDLAGRRVAVVGTGASAIQFIPRIQPLAEHLTVYQRTPPWILPRMDRTLTKSEQQRCETLPLYRKIWRLRIYLERELYGFAFRKPALMLRAKRLAQRHLERSIRDPLLRRKLTPTYEIGCKRVLLSNDYYPALAKPNVEVETDSIAEIRETSIVTASGEERPTDTIILGTGFQISDMTVARLIHGRGGRSIHETMQGSPRAYLGTTFVGVPNFFMLQGPNTGLGHSSVVMMIEMQIGHILKALQHMRRRRAETIECTEQALESFVEQVDGVWEGRSG